MDRELAQPTRLGLCRPGEQQRKAVVKVDNGRAPQPGFHHVLRHGQSIRVHHVEHATRAKVTNRLALGGEVGRTARPGNEACILPKTMDLLPPPGMRRCVREDHDFIEYTSRRRVAPKGLISLRVLAESY